MKAAIRFETAPRSTLGKGAARELRRTGRIPAVLYGKEQAPISFSLDENQFNLFYKKGGIAHKLVDVQLDGKTYHALAREVQLHPVTDKPEHVDFLKVDEHSRVHVFVPVIPLNTDRCIGIKRGGAINIVRHEVELICKPDTIPSAIKVDVLEMNIGDSIHISAVELPKDVTPAIRDRDFTLITLTGRTKKDAEETTAEAAAAAATEAAKDTKK